MNNIDIFTYHVGVFKGSLPGEMSWTTLSRDVHPKDFVEHVWSGLNANLESGPRPGHKAVGFKSFPEHWRDSGNEDTFVHEIMNDPGVQKIVLKREDELAVYVSMLRAEQTGETAVHAYIRSSKCVHENAFPSDRILHGRRHCAIRNNGNADGMSVFELLLDRNDKLMHPKPNADVPKYNILFQRNTQLS